MSPQAQVKSFPGYGVVYPDGVSGVKVVGTFTQGPSKTVNPDGSVAYSTPAPTIHELFGGGFAYASGSPVTHREHLEVLPGGMRERALKWFDGHGELSVVAKENVPPLNLNEQQRPEPVYVISSNVEQLDEPDKKVVEGLGTQSYENLQSPGMLPKILQNSLNSITQSILSLAETVKEQGKQIMELSGQPGKVKHKKFPSDKRSEMMKARWAERKRIKNGKDATETS